MSQMFDELGRVVDKYAEPAEEEPPPGPLKKVARRAKRVWHRWFPE
jgi:hypothetical protein